MSSVRPSFVVNNVETARPIPTVATQVLWQQREGNRLATLAAFVGGLALRPGQKQTVAFTLAGEKLAFWDVKTHGFVVEPGEFDLLVGSSSEDIHMQTRIRVK